MDLADSPEEARFRARLREWLAEHAPVEMPEDPGEHHAALVEWHRLLYRGGWVGMSWPVAYGGQGLSFMEETILQQELGRIGAPPPPAIGYIGRAIMAHGTEVQKRRYLPPLLASEELWCQGFSEPGAGSDLASLTTRARPEGEHFVVDGQKIWTSRGMFADFCFLLARTSTEGPKQAGISVFIVDMHAPGVTVRPITEASGNRHHFCEVFFDGVLVPGENLIGQLNQGWSIAQTTLAYERGPADIGALGELSGVLRRLARLAAEQGRQADPATRRAVAEAAVAVEVLRLRQLAALTRRMDGAEPGPEGSVDKLLMSGADQLLLHTALDILGPAASLGAGSWYPRYLRSRATTILGGTAQIQRNILATRILGLGR
jgi:alkylation response protein AidB-like acyl-CoA dehydrogenase